MALSDEQEWIDVQPNAPLYIPEWSCASTFGCGRQFNDKTYKELDEKMQDLQINNGVNHLDVHVRASDRKGGEIKLLPSSIIFYLPRTAETMVTNVAERLLRIILQTGRTEVTKRSGYISDKKTHVAFVSM
jgi:hypothetical protein